MAYAGPGESSLIDEFQEVLNRLQRETILTEDEILSHLEKDPEVLIPASIFSDRRLGALEAAVKFLKDNRDLSLKDISVILNRDNRSLWATYAKASKKSPEPLPVESKFFVPVSILANRKYSVLEALVSYLRDNFKLKYSQIALILSRDQRTIWTVYHNAKKRDQRKDS